MGVVSTVLKCLLKCSILLFMIENIHQTARCGAESLKINAADVQ